jgi:hypothetical protein
MSDIFISYASDDKSRVEPLAEALKARGWSVWWDRVIPAGKTFDDVIEEAVNAAKCIIVIWSDKSVSSRWVRTEAEEGANRQILMPVLIDNVTIPLAFRRIQAANLIGWQGNLHHPGFDQLVRDISSLIGTPLAPQFAERPSNTNAAPRGQSPAQTPQRSSTNLPERKRSIGFIGKAIPVTLLALWVLGIIFHVAGIFIHIFLLLALILFLINIIYRWPSRA